MESRSGSERPSERIEKVIVSQPKFRNVRLLRNTKYVVKGNVTGKRYVFERAGAIVPVASDDVDELLSKMAAGSCCGGDPSPKKLFDIVGE